MNIQRAAVAAGLFVLAAGNAAAQAPERGTFLLLRGGDTITVEPFARSASRLETEVVTRTPPLRQRLEADLTPDGLVPAVRVAVLPGLAGEAEPAARLAADFRGDSAHLEVQAAGAPPRQSFEPGPGALPYLNLSVAVLEQVVRRARVLGDDPANVPMLNVAAGHPFTVAVTRAGTDSTVILLQPGLEIRLATDAEGRILGGSIPAQGITVARTAATDLNLAAAPPPDYSAPPGAPYRAEEVRVSTPSGVTLAGTLTVPTGARGKVPAVLLLTGSGPQDRDEASPGLPGWRPFRQVADTLSRRGIAVLRLDDRGVGGSGGDVNEATLPTFAEDARAALAFLRERPEVDARRVGILGHSEGGYVGPMVAAEDPALRALVLVAAPARTGRALVEYQNRSVIERNPVLAPAADSLLPLALARVDSVAASVPWFRSLLAHDPIPFAGRLRVPVLILQGETDSQVPAAEAGALAAAIRGGGNRDVTVRLFPEVNHLLVRDPDGAYEGYAALPSLEVVPEVLGALADWLAARLR